ncbi:MAG: hypothetical protein JO360_00005, partial [Acidobacteria bacterium]|nr:hypothetical protein [Acidobacteriota bacterium]
ENVLMINLANRSNQLFGVRHVADRLVPQIIFGAKEYHMFKDDEFEFPPISTLPGQALIKQVPGTYQLETGGRLVIGLEQDRLYIGAWGQDAVNAIANASADEFRRRDMLNDRAKRIYEGVARGDRKALPAEWLRPGGPLEEYADAMQSSWKQFIKENGRLKSIEIVGTVPGVYPVGIQHTSVRLNYENGHVDRQLHWVNDRIIGISQEPPLLAKTSLRAGPKTGLVGWSMIWFKGFQLSFEFAAEHAKTLILQTPGRTIRAKLVSTQFS